jgi:uncharacterized membrane protein (DUF106 family)
MFGMLLVLAVFVGLIWLFVWSIRRSKRKIAELKEKQAEIREQVNQAKEQAAVIAESSITTELSNVEKETNKETFWNKFIITIIAILPTRLITDPILLATSNMDTATRLSKAFGFKLYKCRYCHHYFSSINWACKDSPNKKHHE